MSRNRDRIGKKAFPPSAMMEPLEPRLLLSGCVSAAIVGGNLVITGDGAANSVEVAAMAGDGKYVITPRDGTFVNKSPDPLTVKGKVADVQIKMNAGDDAVTVTGDVARDLVIDGGEGNNTINVSSATIARNLSVRSGSGYDDVRLIFNQVGQDLSINTGFGPAFIALGFSTIGRNLVLAGDRGSHYVDIYDLSVGGDVRMIFGIGQDNISVDWPQVVHITANGGAVSAGADTIRGNLTISTGDDRDSVFVGVITVRGNVWIDTGWGTDTLAVAGSTIGGSTFLATGSGDDVVSLGVPGPSLNTNTFFTPYMLVAGTQFNGRVTVDTGFGNDTITAGTFWEPCPPVAFNGSAIITGGTGTDRFVQGPNVSGRITLREIEPTNKPDLLLSDLEVLSWSTDFVDFRYKVSNIGNKPANLDGPTPLTNVLVSVYLSMTGFDSGLLIGMIDPSGKLDPGQSISGTYHAAAAVDPSMTPQLRMTIYDGPGIPEWWFSNNTGLANLWDWWVI